MRHFLTSFFLCIGTSLSAYTDIKSANRVNSAVPFNEIYATKDQRIEMALAIQDYWKDLNDRLPRLSPSELQWIKSELDTGNQAKLNRVINSKEYPFWELGMLTDQCNDAINGLLAVRNVEQPGNEMFHWTKVAQCYHESNSSISSHLVSAKLYSTNGTTGGHVLDHMILTKILGVIIPSSMADTMGWTLTSQ